VVARCLSGSGISCAGEKSVQEPGFRNRIDYAYLEAGGVIPGYRPTRSQEIGPSLSITLDAPRGTSGVQRKLGFQMV
jgi:hypothetical protein